SRPPHTPSRPRRNYRSGMSSVDRPGKGAADVHRVPPSGRIGAPQPPDVHRRSGRPDRSTELLGAGPGPGRLELRGRPRLGGDRGTAAAGEGAGSAAGARGKGVTPGAVARLFRP